MESETFFFRKCLYQISSHLGRYDVDKIKFMVSDHIPRTLLETARSGFDVFCLMEERNLLTSTELFFLREVLDTVSKSHYIDSYLNARGSAGVALKQIPGYTAGIPDPTRGPASLTSHKKLLGRLGDGMTPENVRDMALFFHGNSIHVRDIEELRTAEKIFDKLESGRAIQSGDYTILYNVLDALGRLDLCEMIVEHCSNSQPTSPQRDTASLLNVRYPHQPPSHVSTLYGTSSGLSTNSSMESRDGANQPHVFLGGKMVVSPSLGPSTPAQLPEDPRVTELEEDRKKLQEELAIAMNITKVQHDRKVQQLESQLQQKIKEVEELRQQTSQLALTPRPPSYLMDKNPHGVALVIVNGKYDKNPLDPELDLPDRQGARHDQRLFSESFTTLNYIVESRTNLTSVEMLGLIAEITGQKHSNHDSFVLCVSTHGVADGLYGSDSVLVSWQEIDSLIKQSHTLRGKPKLCFFQSCRKPHKVNADGPNAPLPPHEDSDIFKVFASTPNKEAYISPQYGSWLASSLHRHFTSPQLMYTHNLETLMNYVCEEVQLQVGELMEGENKVYVQQCVQREKTLTKAVYFFPSQNM